MFTPQVTLFLLNTKIHLTGITRKIKHSKTI